MPGPNDLDLHFFGAGHGRVEIVNLKPQEHAIAMRQILVTDWTVIVSHIPPVQLKDQPSIRSQTLVLGPSVRTSTTKQTLVPAAARFDIVHANQRLWAHRN
jgi:hypothetical protein